jgi:porin
VDFAAKWGVIDGGEAEPVIVALNQTQRVSDPDLGVGGKGLFDSRPLDQFGLGYYFINIDNPKLQLPFQTREFLRDEHGFEGYYNLAITPWLQLTPDIQVVKGAQKDQFTIGRGPLGILPRIDKQSIGTATVLGLRLKIVF